MELIPYLWFNQDFCGEGEVCDQASCRASVVEVSAGGAHTCLRLSTGELRCWGSDYYGNLGDGEARNDPPTPTPVLDITDAAIMGHVSQAVHHLASLTLGAGWANAASVPHSIKKAFNNVAALCVEIEFAIPETDAVVAFLADPSAVAAAAAAPAAGAAAAPAAAAVKAPEPESESEDDGEMSLFD